MEKEKGFPFDAFSMNRLSYYCGQWIHHGSWYPDKKIRLYNRKKGNWTDQVVHEQVVMQPGSSLKHLKGDLTHLAYNDIIEHKSKNEKYSTLAAKALFIKGRRTNVPWVFLHSSWAFVHSYLVRLGFLDGSNGFTIARLIAEMTYLKHSKLLKLQRGTVGR